MGYFKGLHLDAQENGWMVARYQEQSDLIGARLRRGIHPDPKGGSALPCAPQPTPTGPAFGERVQVRLASGEATGATCLGTARCPDSRKGLKIVTDTGVTLWFPEGEFVAECGARLEWGMAA